MRKLYLIGLVLITAMLMTLPSIAQANLLSNPGFEYASDGSTNPDPDALNWARWGDMSRESYAAGNGNYGVAMHGWPTDTAGGFNQDVSATAGTPYAFTIYGTKGVNFSANKVLLKLEWFEADGVTSTGPADEVNIISALTTDWAQYSVSGTAPTGTDIIRVVFMGDNFAGDYPRTAFFDDADLSVVPEPNTMFLVGGGLVGLFSVVRKKKWKK